MQYTILYPAKDLPFNPSGSRFLYLDLNSCFASFEQQENPFFRDRPLVVSAFNHPFSTIIAASVEAKKLGIKTGMKVREGKDLYPNLIVVTSDIKKYLYFHRLIARILSSYSYPFDMSIDEFVLDLNFLKEEEIINVAKRIKKDISEKIGERITVSVGISTNLFLSKVASKLVKPDGLVVINFSNFERYFRILKPSELPGIGSKGFLEIRKKGFLTVYQLYKASFTLLEKILGKNKGLKLYFDLRGWQTTDFAQNKRRSFGSSTIFRKLKFLNKKELLGVLGSLISKMSFNLRKEGFCAWGLGILIDFCHGLPYRKEKKFEEPMFVEADFLEKISLLLPTDLSRPIKKIGVRCFSLLPISLLPQDLFGKINKRFFLSQAQDKLLLKFGDGILGNPYSILYKKF